MSTYLKYIVICSFLHLVLLLSDAQAQDELLTAGWEIEMHDVDEPPTEDEINSVLTDSQGNVYVLGHFSGDITLNQNHAEEGYFYISSSNDSTSDIFLVKYDKDGKLLSSNTIDYAGQDDNASAMAFDPDEKWLYVAANVKRADGNKDAIGYRFNLNLEEQIRFAIADRGGDETADAIVVDALNQVIVSGHFEDSVRKTKGMFLSFFHGDTGNRFRRELYNSQEKVRAEGLVLDGKGHVYVGGHYKGELNDIASGSVSSDLSYDIFIAKYQIADSSLVQTHSFGGSGDDELQGLATNGESLYLTGRFKQTLQFGQGSTALIAEGLNDIFVAKLSLQGAYQQALQIGGNDYEEGHDIEVSNGKVYVTGRINSINEGKGDQAFFKGIDTGEAEADIFLAVFDNNLSSTLFVNRFGDDHLDFGNSLAVAPDGKVYVGGFVNWQKDIETCEDCGELQKNTYLKQFVVPVKPPEPEKPIITSVTPTQVRAGEILTIAGEHFKAPSVVELGEATATLLEEDATTIKVSAPDIPAGMYALTLITNEDTLVYAVADIEIYADTIPPGTGTDTAKISSIAPGNQFYPGTEVVLTGSHLKGASVSLGNNPVSNLVVEDANITFTVPDEADPGTHTIVIVVGEDTVKSDLLTVSILADDQNPAFSEQLLSGDATQGRTFSVKATDLESGLDTGSVTLVYGGIRSQERLTKPMASDGASQFAAVLSAAELQAIGLAPNATQEHGLWYYFMAKDKVGNADSTAIQFIYQQYNDLNLSEVALPIQDAANPQPGDFRMIALPFEGQSFGALLDEIGDKANWRIFSYDPDDVANQLEGYTELSATDRSTPGVGYMLAYRNARGDLKVGGDAVALTPEKTYEITLKQGWNLIGNPFLFTIDLEEILKRHNETGIGKGLKRMENDTLAETTDYQLAPFESAFVWRENADPVTISIKIPSTGNTNARKAADSKPSAYQDLFGTDDWYVPLMLKDKNKQVRSVAFGMHKSAQPSADSLDDLAIPLLMGNQEIYFPHSEYVYPKFSRDMVPRQQNYHWELMVSSAKGTARTLTWQAEQWAFAGKQLWLLDEANVQLINMLETDHYTFTNRTGQHTLRIVYGGEEDIISQLAKHQLAVGQAFPNPAAGTISIPMIVPEHLKQELCTLSIADATGRTVYRQQHRLTPGFRHIVWEGHDLAGNTVSKGLYIYKLQLPYNKFSSTGKIMMIR